MRIVSLLPAATDAIIAMGWSHDLVGVSHACSRTIAASIPRLTTAPDLSATSAVSIDRAIGRPHGSGDDHGIFALDHDALAATRPDLIVSQSTCAACAVSTTRATDVICSLGIDAEVVAYNPRRLDDIPAAIEELGAAIGALRDALALASHVRRRIDFTRACVANTKSPRLAVLEWPDPPYAPGHWVPDMVEAAGASSVLGTPGARSEPCDPAAIAAADPEVVVLAFCGFDLAETEHRLGELGPIPENACLLALDADRLVTRPGPHVADGVEALAWALHEPHPDLQPGEGSVAEWNEGTWRDLGADSRP